jgi:hypothetical protein
MLFKIRAQPTPWTPFCAPFEAVRRNGKAAGASQRLVFLWTAGARVPGATSTRLCFEPSQQQLLSMAR